MMKCPNDGSEMEEVRISIGAATNMHYVPINSGIKGVLGVGRKSVSAYRCPKCGKVELTTETK